VSLTLIWWPSYMNLRPYFLEILRMYENELPASMVTKVTIYQTCIETWPLHGGQQTSVKNSQSELQSNIQCGYVQFCDMKPCAPFTRRLTLKIGKAFSTSLHLWFCMRIPITMITSIIPITVYTYTVFQKKWHQN